MTIVELLILTWIGCVLALPLLAGSVCLMLMRECEYWPERIVGVLLVSCFCLPFTAILKITGLDQQSGPLAYVLTAAATLAAVCLFDLQQREHREAAANDVTATFDRPRFTRRTIS